METLNNKTLSFSTKLFVRAAAAVAVVFSMAACGNKGGGSSTVYPNGLGTLGNVTISNCTTCTSSLVSPLAIDLFNAKTVSGQASFVNMQLIVSGSGFTPGVSSSYNLYSGPVAIQGQFVATSNLVDPVNPACVIPAGTYVVQTSSVGSMSMGTLQIPELISATGNIRMKVSEGLLYKDASTQTTRMFGSVYITSVNGAICSNAFSDTFN